MNACMCMKKQLGYEVNVLGTENVCKAVEMSGTTRGLILSGTWHIFGDVDLKGVINEETSLRADKVEERAKYYALTKVVQENVVRLFDEKSQKIFGIIRCGTILGQAMPEKTAAKIFVTNTVKGEAITPFKHSMHRPMLYVDADDVCRAFESYARKILNSEVEKRNDSLRHIVNFAYPKPVTILELAKIVRNAVIEISKGTLTPEIEIVDKKLPDIYENTNEKLIKFDMQKAKSFLGIEKLTSPEESVKKLVMSFLR